MLERRWITYLDINLITKNLFLPFTEYHLLLCASIVKEYFHSNSFENHICIISGEFGRISSKKKMQFENMYIHCVESSEHAISFISRFRSEKWERVLIFHEYQVLSNCILNEMECITYRCLVEDGTAMYQSIDRTAVPSRILRTLRNYWEAKKLGLKHRFRIVSNKRDKLEFFSELWLTHPEMWKSQNNKLNLNGIHLLDSDSKYNLSLKLFQVEGIDRIEDCLFYIGRVSFNEQYLRDEISVLRTIMRARNRTKLVIKPHPLSRESQIESYKEGFSNLEILNSELPAELFLYCAKNVTVVAMDSTSLYYHGGKDCVEYLVLYQSLQKKGSYPQWRFIPFPNHVSYWPSQYENNAKSVI